MDNQSGYPDVEHLMKGVLEGLERQKLSVGWGQNCLNVILNQ